MSLKSVLTELSETIQSCAQVPGPLTLQDMTNAVKNIKDGNSVKFYRCAEYSPAASTIYIEQGLMTLFDGTKISLTGEYISTGGSWVCQATVPQNEYQSIAAEISRMVMNGGVNPNSFWAIVRNDTVDVLVKIPGETVYLADATFITASNEYIDQEIVLSGDSASFTACFSGYEINSNNEYWSQSSELTRGLPAKFYTPIPGYIYSDNTNMIINSYYPEVPQDIPKFYECTSYTPNVEAHTRYIMTLSGAADEKINGVYVRTKWQEEEPDEWTDTPLAVWSNESGCKIKEYYYTEFNYCITDSSGNTVYSSDEPYWSRVTDYSSIIWWGAAEEADVTLDFSAITPEEVPATTESWSGYEMIKYNRHQTFVVSGAAEEECNGIYTVYKFSNNPLSIVYSNGSCFLLTVIGSGLEYSRWAISDQSSYSSDATFFYKSASFLNTERLTPLQTTWNTVTLSPPPDGWIRSDRLKENMQATYLKPQVGYIYSEDTSIQVRKMYDGATYPIPTDGLVFYAPLASDYVDMVSGQAAPVTGGTFTTHKGLYCLQLDGSEYIKWPDNADLPAGDVPYSIVILAAPTDIYDWKTFLSIGQPGENEICIHAKSGRLEEFASVNITNEGKWHALALTRDASGGAKTYINGKLDGSGNRTNSVPSPACVCVGANIASNFDQKTTGCIAFAAVYNRELSADEVAQIHAALMADVVQ